MSDGNTAGRAPGIMEKLFAFVRAYGIDSPELGLRFVAMRYPSAALILIVSDPERSQMLIAAGHTGYTNPMRIELSFGKDGADGVIWDPDVPADDLQVFVDGNETVMAEMGYYDPAAGARTRPPDWVLDTLFRRRVALVFDGEFARLRVPTDDTSVAEGIRKQFDRPGDLAVFVNCFGEIWLCRAADFDEFDRRNAVMARLAPKYGAKCEADLDAMPPERKASYVAELMRAMAKPLN